VKAVSQLFLINKNLTPLLSKIEIKEKSLIFEEFIYKV